jgi:hypothetical protein
MPDEEQREEEELLHVFRGQSSLDSWNYCGNSLVIEKGKF